MATRLTRAERREQTSGELIEAAERAFVENGFHATSIEQIAADAGYTKGAVYSNFASKDALFLAVYARRAERVTAELEQTLDELGMRAGIEQIAAEVAKRRGSEEDGWLAVFFEFWAHIVRHPELRERFAEIHARAQAPLAKAFERFLAERGIDAPEDPASMNVALYVMQLGLSLERLTQPEMVDAGLGARMGALILEMVEQTAKAKEKI